MLSKLRLVPHRNNHLVAKLRITVRNGIWSTCVRESGLGSNFYYSETFLVFILWFSGLNIPYLIALSSVPHIKRKHEYIIICWKMSKFLLPQQHMRIIYQRILVIARIKLRASTLMIAAIMAVVPMCHAEINTACGYSGTDHRHFMCIECGRLLFRCKGRSHFTAFFSL